MPAKSEAQKKPEKPERHGAERIDCDKRRRDDDDSINDTGGRERLNQTTVLRLGIGATVACRGSKNRPIQANEHSETQYAGFDQGPVEDPFTDDVRPLGGKDIGAGAQSHAQQAEGCIQNGLEVNHRA